LSRVVRNRRDKRPGADDGQITNGETLTGQKGLGVTLGKKVLKVRGTTEHIGLGEARSSKNREKGAGRAALVKLLLRREAKLSKQA